MSSTSSSSSEDDSSSGDESSSTTTSQRDDNLSEPVLKKFKWALKKVNCTEKKRDESGAGKASAALTEQELINLIRLWEPKRDIVSLYVRWSRQLRRNFNLDSISTLLCLSRQCGYTPVNFLVKVKTLTVHLQPAATLGVMFHFGVAANQKDVDEEQLNKEYIGLSVTLALLQEQVSESPSVLGKVGMRHKKGARAKQSINVPIPSQSNTAEPIPIESQPNVEFHTQQSLLNRIWLSINHRWIAFHLLEFLFREEDCAWSHLDMLVYSFQMMSPCGPVRYEFLAPLVGYCLRFSTIQVINSQREKLRQIHKDPRSFHSFGCTCQLQYPIETQAQLISSCIRELRTNIKRKKLCYNRFVCSSIRFTMLRAYIFHFWLESTTNSKLKNLVTTDLDRIKKKKNCQDPELSEGNTKQATLVSKNISRTLTENEDYATSDTFIQNGIESILSSRKEVEPKNVLDSTMDSNFDSNVNSNTDTTYPMNADQSKDLSTDTSIDSVNNTFLQPWEISETNWSSLRLVSQKELTNLIQSYFMIHRKDGVVVISALSPLEVYSADNLHDLPHRRCSKKSPYFPKELVGQVMFHIDSEIDYFLDKAAKSLHVAREGSGCFKEHSRLIPSITCLQELCRAVVVHGEVDNERGVGQFRINIGNGGRNWEKKTPCLLHGLKFEKDLIGDDRFDASRILKTIGSVTEFTWHVCNSMQVDASDNALAPNKLRRQMYATHLMKYLGSKSTEVGFEDITIVVSLLHPVVHEVAVHKDTMNDTLVGYTRTAAFNIVLKDDSVCMIHLQVICNFRKVIGHYMVSFHRYLSPIVSHARQYTEKWNRNMYTLYAGKTIKVPTMPDRESMFLDDSLEYSCITISDRKHNTVISGEYILTEIGASRTLSFSMFIDPLVNIQGYLKTDQIVELTFLCSFLSNPFRFNWTMTKIIARLEDPHDPLVSLSIHPFYDWYDNTMEHFGSWQGGPYNRWSPCGGNGVSLPEVFGAGLGITEEERKVGELRLTHIVSVLLDHMNWINTLVGKGEYPADDLPLEMIKRQYEMIVKRISRIAQCQFNYFRLCVFTTLIAGSGLLETGCHLRQLMFPINKTASYKHLLNPVSDVMTKEKATALGMNEGREFVCNDGDGSVSPEHHDMFMEYMSTALGFQVYCRDEMECLLCESHPMRTLNCKDWFVKGMNLYDCNSNGEYFKKPYGRSSKWILLSPPKEYTYAYHIKRTVFYKHYDNRLMSKAGDFGTKLREDVKDVKYRGRSSKTSVKHRTFTNHYNQDLSHCHTSIQTAYWYIGSMVASMNLKSMYVLGDGEKAIRISDCNDIEAYEEGKQLMDTIRELCKEADISTDYMGGACYHRDAETDAEEVTFFPGHLDKVFVHTVCFIPIGTVYFFVVIAVPEDSGIEQDENSLQEFNDWKDVLTMDYKKKLERFLEAFTVQATEYMRQQRLASRVFVSNTGTILCFPANAYYHASIIPKRGIGCQRDLLILHPLDGL